MRDKCLLFIVLLCSYSAFALELPYDSELIPSHYNYTHAEDKFSYSFVMKSCDNFYLGSREIHHETMLMHLKTYTFLDDNGVHKIKKTKGHGQILDKLLKSQGFYHALDDCFGDSELKKEAYVIGLIGASSFGALRGIAGGIVSFVAGGVVIKGAGWLLKLISPRLYQFLTRKAYMIGVGVVGGTLSYYTYEYISEQITHLESLTYDRDEYLRQKVLLERELAMINEKFQESYDDLNKDQKKVVRKYISEVNKRIDGFNTKITSVNDNLESSLIYEYLVEI